MRYYILGTLQMPATSQFFYIIALHRYSNREVIISQFFIAEKLSIIQFMGDRAPNPASLTRLSTNIMLAIHVSLVPLSRALIRFNPYPFLACPNLPSIGFRSPGLT